MRKRRRRLKPRPSLRKLNLAANFPKGVRAHSAAKRPPVAAPDNLESFMSFANFKSPRARRRAVLASVAVAGLATAGALGGGALTGSDVALATALSTTDM